MAETIDIAGMLAILHKIYAASDTETEVALKISGEPPFRVAAIEDRLVQVFRNLLQNAISFSPPSGRVTLSLARRDSDIEIDVCDDGPGLPEGKLDAVFDRFYTERPQGEKFGTHSGLGLSISRQIVEAHGGSIRAENRYTSDRTVRGARFIVRLPLSDN